MQLDFRNKRRNPTTEQAKREKITRITESTNNIKGK